MDSVGEAGKAGTTAAARRWVVVGTTGSGKTTFAGQLARRLGVPHVELDALYWDADWTPAPRAEFRRRVAEALQGECWVVDGNYSQVRDIVWARAEALVWLNYPLGVILYRLLVRSLRRVVMREVMWNGNQERWRTLFFSRESILLWALQTYRRHRRDYPLLFARPEHAHLAVLRFRSPRHAEQWLAAREGS